MKRFKNRVQLSGFAGTDPVIVNFSEEKRMARLSLALDEFYKNKEGELHTRTQWFNLVFWNAKAAQAEQLIRKGTGISIEGSLHIQRYTDKKGESRFSTEIFVSHLELLEPVTN